MQHSPSDADARRQALDPMRSFIVQAPAGSGKTELLTQRYLRLLALVESPEQILAITFTRKAAAEMRSRVMRALAGAASPAPQSAHKRATWELARAVRAADARREWRLMDHPARLRIQTIDALNAQLARRLPVLAGLGAPLEPTEDPWPLYEEACERLLDRLGEDGPEMASLEALIAHLGNRIERLVEMLTGLLAKRDQWLHAVVQARASGGLRELLEGVLRALVERRLARLTRELSESQRREMLELAQFAAGNLLAGGAPSAERRRLLEACLQRVGPPDGNCNSLHAWQVIASMLFRSKGALYRRLDARHGFPPANGGMKTRIGALLADLAERPELCEQLHAVQDLPEPVYAAAQWRILQALLDVLPLAAAQLQLVFQRRGQSDYIESALRALRALGTHDEPTDLALAFDCRLQHILVDEFQDTSFSQLDLLERLTEGWSPEDGRTLFCVGDPMQSIYRFRQAEVGLFLQLQSEGLRNVALEPLTLHANFRSNRPIVEWVNRVFPRVLSSENDAEEGAVRYSPSEAAVTNDDGGVYVHPLIDADEYAEAAQVVEVVRRALARSEQETVAVLVTARPHVGFIARELALAAIDFQAVEIEQLRERPVVQDLMALTRALAHPADRTAWLAVLRGPCCGLTLAELHALVAEDRSSSIHELLGRASGVREARAFATLDAALRERGRWPLREWVERTWNALGGPAVLTRPQDLEDAEAYFRRLEQIEICGDLDDVARLDQQLDKLFARPRAGVRARVEVMTIHKAKGLEFDTVILPGLHRGIRGEQRELLRWTRIAGADGGVVFAPIKAEGANPDPVYRWIERLEQARMMRERSRLLYVAATRARRELHVFGSARLGEKDGEPVLAPPREGSMLAMLWHELEPQFARVAAQQPRGGAGVQALRSDALRRLPQGWLAPAADPPFNPAAALSKPLAAARPEFDWASEVSRHVGTLVHRELDRLVRSRIEHPNQALAAASGARTRLRAELAELGVPADRCAEACERVLTAIQHTLEDARGRWLLGLEGGVREAESELALSGFVAGDLLEGVIDRTFVDATGVRWIVDFKTSTHEGGGLEAFLDEEVERYRGQLARYAKLMRLYRPSEPTRAALYFPLLKAWREAPV
ncbi:MAG TPA: UvrD-helicase domain-containing protein [Steroidobacter sp.]|nr:UvrD-helicase domain-containing protein [Steroidobacteraceae bacterium]HLS81821.1 UvrD-helicase domain-containing protein [Steroidobacter sp.]